MPVKAKFIEWYLAAPVSISGFSASGSSANITTALGTALATAGNGGVAVPVQEFSGANKIGVITSGPANRCRMVNSTSGDDILSAAGDLVFAELTLAATVYTLTFYTVTDAGVKTAYSFGSTTPIQFFFNYRFDMYRVPDTALVLISNSAIKQHPLVTAGAASATPFIEVLPVTAQNVITPLTNTPVTNTLRINYEGIIFSILSGGGFTLAGKQLTSTLPYAIEVGERIEVFYSF